MIEVLIVLLIAGFLICAFTTAPIPIHPWFKNVIVGIVCLYLFLGLLNFFGVSTGVSFPHLHFK